MNWIDFDQNEKRTYPVMSEENIIIFLYNTGAYDLIFGNINQDLTDLKAYMYVAPYKRKFEEISVLLSKAKSLMHCKPISLQELEERVFELSEQDYAYLLSKVEVHKRSELFEEEHLLSFFNKQVPQYFILENNNDFYVVDTQGYNYCRYMVKVVLENNNQNNDF